MVSPRCTMQYCCIWPVRVIELLLDRADINPRLRDKEGRTALDIAEEQGFDDLAAYIGGHH